VWGRRLDDRSGGSYTVQRAGEVLVLDVPWKSLSLGHVLRRLAPHASIAWVLFAALGAVFFQDANVPVLPFLMAIAWIQGMNELLDGVSRLGANVTVEIAWLSAPWVLLTFSLVNSLLLHILLMYPERKRWIIRYPWAPYGFHALNLLLALFAWWGVGSGPLLANRTWILRSLMQPVSGIEILLGVGSLVHTYVRSRQRGVRSQVPWLIWGVLLEPAAWLVLYRIPTSLSGQPWVPLWVTDLPIVLVVLSFVISMSHHALMSVDLWVNRVMVYGALTGILVGLFLVISRALVQVVALDREWVGALTVGLIALVTPSLHEVIQEGVNRVFFKRWLSAQALFRDVSTELSTTLETDDLARILVSELPQRLRVTQAALFLQQPDGDLKAVDDISGWPIPPDHPLLQELAEVRSPLILSQAKSLSPLLRALRDESWEIILPLRSGEALVGLYLLGVHLSGRFYGRSEVETLALLGERIGLTLENARLYEEIERYSENLERLVRQRTQDLRDANLALSAERDRLQVILQNITDGLVYVNAEGAVTLVNRAFETLIGRTAETMLGRSPVKAGIPAFIDELIHTAQGDRGMVLAKDYALNEYVVRLSVIGLPGPGGVIVVLRDITRDVEVNRMKSQFFSAVSHELRTPLTSILGFSKITERFVDDRLMPEVREDARVGEMGERVRHNLEIITAEGQRLMSLIDDLLEITAFDTQTAAWNDRPCALPALIQNAIETQRESAAAKGLILQARMASDLPTMMVDPDRVTQLLRNLISNLIKLTREGGIQLSAHRLAPGTEIQGWRVPASGAVLVAVRDTGMGFDLGQVSQVFGRFDQIDTLVEAQPSGTELGLAICQEIVSHYDGILWVESDPERGSTFSFALPVVEQVESVA
jgi:PAS domain S-box-containing protein